MKWAVILGSAILFCIVEVRAQFSGTNAPCTWEGWGGPGPATIGGACGTYFAQYDLPPDSIPTLGV